MLRWLLLLAFGAMLGACGEDVAETASDGAAPTPLLYEVSDRGGAVRGWLFGTIHSLPDGTRWRTGTLEDRIDAADLLMVEIADLANSAALSETFTRLAIGGEQPDLSLRVEPSARPDLVRLIERSDFSEADFHRIETWAAALMLARLLESGKSENGADRAMIAAFAGREIREFEGAEVQLGIFDQLPESEQEDLLIAVVEEVENRTADPAELRRAWLAGDVEALVEASESGILADPELREALLTGRNRRWTQDLVGVMDQGRLPFVAVGAAHLVGPDGLKAMLEERGFTVSRIQ